MEEETITYNPKYEKRWISGIDRGTFELQEEWLSQYSSVLSRSEYESFVKNQLIMGNKRLYHFAEWYVAIEYYKQGWMVLVEQYMFPKHKKIDKVKQLVGEDKMHFIQSAGSGVTQAPDLLIYNSEDEYFFVDVKKKGDRLSERQKEHFEKIIKELGCKVKIVNLVPDNSNTSS